MPVWRWRGCYEKIFDAPEGLGPDKALLGSVRIARFSGDFAWKGRICNARGVEGTALDRRRGEVVQSIWLKEKI